MKKERSVLAESKCRALLAGYVCPEYVRIFPVLFPAARPESFMTYRYVFAALVLASGAACTDMPTSSASNADPRYNGGWTIGSGRSDSTTVTQTSTETTTACSEENGGWTIGSGGVTQPPQDPCADQ